MRQLFILLLGVNLLIFMWFYFKPPQVDHNKSIIPENVDKLVLLREIDKAALTLTKHEPQKEEIKPVAVKKPKLDQCFTVGPFKDENVAGGFKLSIKNRVVKSSIRSRTEQQHWGYRVYLEPQPSKTKAVSLAASLAKEGVKDYFVISRGEKVNGIALGHFKDKKLAQARLAKIKKMGYKPKMESVKKDYTLYWLDYQVRASKLIPVSEISDLVADDSINQFNRDCGK